MKQQVKQTTSRPGISIVILAYNEEAYLKACLDSIARQTRFPNEVIVVDNNSTDNTAAIAASYPFVRVVREPTQGIIAARNRGFYEARYEIIGRIDADTVLSPNWVATGLQYLQQHPETTAITGKAQFYDIRLSGIISRIHTLMYYHAQRIIAGQTILWGATMMVRRSDVIKIIPQCPMLQSANDDIYMSLVMKQHGLRTAYLASLIVGVSMQRGNFAPHYTIKYLSLWPKNYELLGMPVRGLFIRALLILILLVAVPIGAVYCLLHDRSGLRRAVMDDV